MIFLDCSTPESKCHQARPVSEDFGTNSKPLIFYFFNDMSRRCEPFLHTHYKDFDTWSNVFDTDEKCRNLCMKNETKSSIDKTMPSSIAPRSWQCTDVPALKDLPKNRSCLAFDNSKGYTYLDGQCVPSDYSGCIDTYNKFKDIDTCTQSMAFIEKSDQSGLIKVFFYTF